MRAADVVVCHAGAGSILLARRCGHRPIVMARLGELGEAVDDHQLIMARRLDASGVVTLVADAAELREAVAAALASRRRRRRRRRRPRASQRTSRRRSTASRRRAAAGRCAGARRARGS